MLSGSLRCYCASKASLSTNVLCLNQAWPGTGGKTSFMRVLISCKGPYDHLCHHIWQMNSQSSSHTLDMAFELRFLPMHFQDRFVNSPNRETLVDASVENARHEQMQRSSETGADASSREAEAWNDSNPRKSEFRRFLGNIF